MFHMSRSILQDWLNETYLLYSENDTPNWVSRLDLPGALVTHVGVHDPVHNIKDEK
jgi:hypothetical protein